MGGQFSCGVDNDDLIDKMVQSGYIRSVQVEAVCRAVDRGDYITENDAQMAYSDCAWQSEKLHLSAPCIYSHVLEMLELKPGHSFLNLGSGTGYLSTIAGLILGTYGVNHGIELHEELVLYANNKLKRFMEVSPALDEFDFCIPSFNVGNCLSLPESYPLYDRVYCGASCVDEYFDRLKRLLKVGGMLVMPFRDELVRIERLSNSSWETKPMHTVHFTTLVPPTREQTENPPEKSDFLPPSLQFICRDLIRTILRKSVFSSRPDLAESFKLKSNGDKKSEVTMIRIPLNSEYTRDFSGYHHLDEESGSREMDAILSVVYNFYPGRDFSSEDSSGDEDYENTSDEDRHDEEIEHEYYFANTRSRTSSQNGESATGSIETETTSSNTSSQQSNRREKLDSGIGEDISSNGNTNQRQTDSNTSIASSDDENMNEDRPNTRGSQSQKKHRKRFHSDEEDIDNNSNNDSPDDTVTSECTHDKKVQKRMRNSNFHTKRRETISKNIKEKILQLPLPLPLQLYINFNREF